MPQALLVTGGFLAAVLWVDLMFDVQAAGVGGTLPADVLTTLVDHYRHVTTTADPMGNVVSLVLLLTVLGSVTQLANGALPWWLRGSVLLTALLPALYMLILLIPAATRLGDGAAAPAAQSELARTLLSGHATCLALIAIYLGLQIVAARRTQPAVMA